MFKPPPCACRHQEDDPPIERIVCLALTRFTPSVLSPPLSLAKREGVPKILLPVSTHWHATGFPTDSFSLSKLCRSGTLCGQSTTNTLRKNANNNSPGRKLAFASEREEQQRHQGACLCSPIPSQSFHLQQVCWTCAARTNGSNRWNLELRGACLTWRRIARDRRPNPDDRQELPLELRVPHSPPRPWGRDKTGKVNKPFVRFS